MFCCRESIQPLRPYFAHDAEYGSVTDAWDVKQVDSTEVLESDDVEVDGFYGVLIESLV